MSHIVKEKLRIFNLDALAQACKNLGVELRMGQKTHKWYGQWMGDYPLPEGYTTDDLGKCDHAIRVPGNPQAYEIGVVQQRDAQGGYALMYDFWAGGYGLMDKVGKNCDSLYREYAIQATLQQQYSEGLQVDLEKNARWTGRQAGRF